MERTRWNCTIVPPKNSIHFCHMCWRRHRLFLGCFHSRHGHAWRCILICVYPVAVGDGNVITEFVVLFLYVYYSHWLSLFPFVLFILLAIISNKTKWFDLLVPPALLVVLGSGFGSGGSHVPLLAGGKPQNHANFFSPRTLINFIYERRMEGCAKVTNIYCFSLY